LEIGDWRLEIGDWRRAEIGDWRLEIGDWRLEIGEEEELLVGVSDGFQILSLQS